jgi:hypothetical protein
LNTDIPRRGLSDKEAAQYAGLPVATFRRAAKEKGLAPVILGGRKRYDRLAIDSAFFASPPPPDPLTCADSWIEKLK